MKSRRFDDAGLHAAAATCTALILLLSGRLLSHLPAPAPLREAAQASTRLVFVERLPTAQPAMPPPPRPAATSTAPGVPTSPPATGAPATTTARPAPAPPALRPASTLYTAEGQVRLGTIDSRAASARPPAPPGTEVPAPRGDGKRLFERPNPIDYRRTRFAKDWASDGTLGDVAIQGLERTTKQAKALLSGPPTQVARARPAPDIRFNPALAENQAELGSEATGDAYKAAPIAHETLPGLDGSASARIRAQWATLKAMKHSCGPGQAATLWQPVAANLARLERAEYLASHGADPLMLQHTLPQDADSAYDLARRALWHAERRLSRCGTDPAGNPPAV